MGDYRNLMVWQRAHAFALRVYAITSAFPRSEVYGLTSQIRRAAVSIPSNLAEGSGRRSDSEMIRFARVALGSANELEYQLLLARELGFVSEVDHAFASNEIREIKGMLERLASSLAGTRSR